MEFKSAWIDITVRVCGTETLTANTANSQLFTIYARAQGDIASMADTDRYALIDQANFVSDYVVTPTGDECGLAGLNLWESVAHETVFANNQVTLSGLNLTTYQIKIDKSILQQTSRRY